MTVVDLNVGGVRFTTTKSTLTREPESMLARMFEGELAPCEQDREGRHVIDRSAETFKYVLAYLRGDTGIFPTSKTERLQLLADADYYQLEGLQQQLSAAGISSFDPSPEQQCLPAAAAHCAAIDNAIKNVPNPVSYVAARDALISKFWASFRCPINHVNKHQDCFTLRDWGHGTQLDDWICRELRQTACILQHDLERLGYRVQLEERTENNGPETYHGCPDPRFNIKILDRINMRFDGSRLMAVQTSLPAEITMVVQAMQ